MTDNTAFATENGGVGVTTEERLAEMKLPKLRFADFEDCIVQTEKERFSITLKNGVKLVEFRLVGMTGGLYKTWLEIE